MTQNDGDAAFYVDAVSKAFNATVVLRDLAFIGKPGDITLLLGANGSGKSTLLRLCAGLLRPESGKVSFAKRAPQVGYVGHQSLVYGALTVKENVEFFGALLGEDSIEELLVRWDLERFKSATTREVSRGTSLRLGLCRAFMGNPDYLFLDEPTGALDERAVEIFRQQIARLLKEHPNCSVLIATHDVNRLADIANRVVVINEGTIALDSSTLGDRTNDRVIEYYRSLNR